jgi:putative acetyltransferase
VHWRAKVTQVIIRPEREEDEPATARLVEAAFGRADETRLVDRLRADGDTVISLVARVDASIVGHGSGVGSA